MARYQVYTESELRKVMAIQEPTKTIEVMARISLYQRDTVDCRADTLELVPGAPYAELAAPWHFNGKWDDPANWWHVIQHWGSKLYCGVGFSWYNCGGNFLKAMAPCATVFEGASFNDIGARVFSPKVAVPRSASDVVYTCLFATHQRGQKKATLDVRGCHFERCSLNSCYWAHVFYTEVDRASFRINTVRSCGEFSGVEANLLEFRDNVVTNDLAVPTPNGKVTPNAAWLPSTGLAVITGNQITCGVQGVPQPCVYNGYPDPSRHYIEDNAYRLTSGPIASKLGVGPVSKVDWTSLGFDTRSTFGA